MFIILTNDNGITTDLNHIGLDRDVADNHFIDACKANISNWDDYTDGEIEDIFADGYVEFGGGKILMFVDTDGFTTDSELTKMFARKRDEVSLENENA